MTGPAIVVGPMADIAGGEAERKIRVRLEYYPTRRLGRLLDSFSTRLSVNDCILFLK